MLFAWSCLQFYVRNLQHWRDWRGNKQIHVLHKEYNTQLSKHISTVIMVELVKGQMWYYVNHNKADHKHSTLPTKGFSTVLMRCSSYKQLGRVPISTCRLHWKLTEFTHGGSGLLWGRCGCLIFHLTMVSIRLKSPDHSIEFFSYK